MSLYQRVTDAELKDLRAEFDRNADMAAEKYRAAGVTAQQVASLQGVEARAMAWEWALKAAKGRDWHGCVMHLLREIDSAGVDSLDLLRALALGCFLARRSDRTTGTAASYLTILNACGNKVRARDLITGGHHDA